MSNQTNKDQSFTQKLARVFDDNLATVQWKNIVDKGLGQQVRVWGKFEHRRQDTDVGVSRRGTVTKSMEKIKNV